MRFTINLSTRIHLDHRQINRYAAVVICVLVALIAWNVVRVSTNMGEMSRLDSEISAIQARIGAKPNTVSETEYSRRKSQIRFYNEIIERKGKNWLESLSLLESVTPDGIAIAALVPDKKQNEWKIDGYAKSFNGVQQYLEKLELSKKFTNIMLVSHQNMADGEKTRGIKFIISCEVVN